MTNDTQQSPHGEVLSPVVRFRRLITEALYNVLATCHIPLSPHHVSMKLPIEVKRLIPAWRAAAPPATAIPVSEKREPQSAAASLSSSSGEGSSGDSSESDSDDDEDRILHRVSHFGEKGIRRLCLQLTAGGGNNTSTPALREWVGCFLLSSREFDMMRNALVTREYQALGMTVMVLDDRPEANYPKRCAVYIPSDAEHRFVEVRESTIPGAGLGLYLRTSRRIRQGTIVCEYVGKRLATPPKDTSLCPYMIHMQRPDAAGHCYIDGVDRDGNLLCLASCINDRGEDGATVEFVEFPSLPGRIFVSAICDLQPGGEIFVCYGRYYWGKSVAGQPKVGAADTNGVDQRRTKRARVDAPLLQRCRRCGGMFAHRMLRLHMKTCGDQLTEKRLFSLETLPANEFTMFDDQQFTHEAFRLDMRLLPKRCVAFVSRSDASTFGMSHVDVVDWLNVEVVSDGDDNPPAVPGTAPHKWKRNKQSQ